jgi:hypothetical protein
VRRQAVPAETDLIVRADEVEGFTPPGDEGV